MPLQRARESLHKPYVFRTKAYPGRFRGANKQGTHRECGVPEGTAEADCQKESAICAIDGAWEHGTRESLHQDSPYQSQRLDPFIKRLTLSSRRDSSHLFSSSRAQCWGKNSLYDEKKGGCRLWRTT